MRQHLSQLEALAPAPFILTTGAIGGAVRGIPVFFLSNANVTGLRWAQVTLALAVADLLMTALSFVSASIETKGEIVFEVGSALPMVVVSNLGLTAFRSAFWLIEALVLVALGRLVLRMDEQAATQSATAL